VNLSKGLAAMGIIRCQTDVEWCDGLLMDWLGGHGVGVNFHVLSSAR
jgi:hypothetical protein